MIVIACRPTDTDGVVEVIVEYRWRYQNAQGRDVDGPGIVFGDQVRAENWLSETWAGLLDAGVEQVTLLHGEAEVYGPMSLRSAS